MRDQLQSKYPEHKVVSEPLSDCPRCKGKGEFVNKLQQTKLCMCTMLSGSDELRRAAAESFVKTISQARKDLLSGKLIDEFMYFVHWISKKKRK